MNNKNISRILMFAPAFAPFANPEAIVNSKLVLAFLDAGLNIDVITRNLAKEWTSYNYGSEWVDPWLSLQDHTYVVSYQHNGRIRRLVEAGSGFLRMGHPVDGCRWAVHALDLALKLHKEKSYQVILSRSSPDAAHLPAMAMAQLKGLPWVANWNDPSGAKHPPPYGKGADVSLGYFHERFLNGVAKNASWHTFPSERMRRYICKYLGSDAERKSSVIPHVTTKTGANLNRKRNDIFTICHAGHISRHRNPEVFLKALADFASDEGLSNHLRLLFIGLDDLGVHELSMRFGLGTNVQIRKPLSYKATMDTLAEGDVLLVLEAPCEEGIYLPAKFVDYLQTYRPILAVTPGESTLKDIISTHGGGIAVNCSSSKEIAAGLRELYEHWKDGTLEKQYGSHCLSYHFSPDKIIGIYKNMFDEVGVPNI